MRALSPSVRLLCMTAVLCTSACATRLPSLAAAPPAGVDLSGEWRINLELSDKPAEVVVQHPPRQQPEPPFPWRRGGIGKKDDSKAEIRLPKDDGSRESLLAAQQLSISQRGFHVIVHSSSSSGDDEETVDYRAGSKTRAAYGWDMADRYAGWRGDSFVVLTQARMGRVHEVSYWLDESGRLQTLTEASGRSGGALKIKRVYDRAETRKADTSS